MSQRCQNPPLKKLHAPHLPHSFPSPPYLYMLYYLTHLPLTSHSILHPSALCVRSVVVNIAIIPSAWWVIWDVCLDSHLPPHPSSLFLLLIPLSPSCSHSPPPHGGPNTMSTKERRQGGWKRRKNMDGLTRRGSNESKPGWGWFCIKKRKERKREVKGKGCLREERSLAFLTIVDPLTGW